jgi:hypothetical protein
MRILLVPKCAASQVLALAQLLTFGREEMLKLLTPTAVVAVQRLAEPCHHLFYFRARRSPGHVPVRPD